MIAVTAQRLPVAHPEADVPLWSVLSALPGMPGMKSAICKCGR
jgi:hypothetical protein